MTYTVEITETYYTTVSFETEEEAKEFMKKQRSLWKNPIMIWLVVGNLRMLN